jgi:hypothetical protein
VDRLSFLWPPSLPLASQPVSNIPNPSSGLCHLPLLPPNHSRNLVLPLSHCPGTMFRSVGMKFVRMIDCLAWLYSLGHGLVGFEFKNM